MHREQDPPVSQQWWNSETNNFSSPGDLFYQTGQVKRRKRQRELKERKKERSPASVFTQRGGRRFLHTYSSFNVLIKLSLKFSTVPLI